MAGPELGHDFTARLIEEFLGDSFDSRTRWLDAREKLTPEGRSLTGQLIESLETSGAHDPAVVESVPLMIADRLGGEFLDVFGEPGPPRPAVTGELPSERERRSRLVALLRMGLETDSRAEGLEVLGRLEATRTQIPGLGPSFVGWLYVLAPDVFPPIPSHVVRGVRETLSGSGGIVDSARKLWGLADTHAGLLDTYDLAVAAAFVGRLGERGPDALAAKGDDYFGFNRLVQDTLLSETFLERLEQDLRENGLLLFTGPQGTGKTHTAVRLVRYMCREGGEFAVVRAHPALGYEQLVGSATRPGLLTRMAERARADRSGTYALLVDDMDHLEVRTALGELSLAFEFPGQAVTLPGGERFKFPTNFALLATAATSQHDLLKRDYAFFRRFSHAEFAPDPKKLGEWLRRHDDPIKRIDLVHAFRNLNRLLRERTGGRFAVGQGYLMVEGLTDDNLNLFWETYVIPYVRANLADTTTDVEVYRLSRLV